MRFSFLAIVLLATSAAASHLVPRKLPYEYGCHTCKDGDKKALNDLAIARKKLPRDIYLETIRSTKTNKLWSNAEKDVQICRGEGYEGFTCIWLGPGIKYDRGGINDPMGHWRFQDGTQLYVYTTWQSTIEYSLESGGTLSVYPAHCTILAIARGAMKVTVNGEVHYGDGIRNNQAKPKPHCFENHPSATIYIWEMK